MVVAEGSAKVVCPDARTMTYHLFLLEGGGGGKTARSIPNPEFVGTHINESLRVLHKKYQRRIYLHFTEGHVSHQQRQRPYTTLRQL
jgi:hypothetical protein